MFFLPNNQNPMTQEQFNHYCQCLPLRTQYTDENGKLGYKLLTTIYYNPNEQFKIYPFNSKYAVSDCGTVVDLEKGIKLTSAFQDNSKSRNIRKNDKYDTVANPLDTSQNLYQVHRMVLETHAPEHRPDQEFVNHINGIKQDNRLENLEWCSASENMQHAVRTGLIPRGENRNNNVFTNEQVHTICQFMEQGYQNSEIYEMMGRPGTNKYQFLRFCHNLREHGDKIWSFITSQYKIPSADITYHSKEEIVMICELIIQGLNNKEIADICMRDFHHNRFSEGYIRIIRYCNPLYQPELWEIVKDYKDKFPSKVVRLFTDEQIEIMCEYLNRKAKPQEIAEALGVPDDKTLRFTLSQLRRGIIYPKISSKYPNISMQNRRRFTEEEADMIWTLRKQGLTSRQIAEKMNREYTASFATTVGQIMKGSIFPSIKEKHANDDT